MARPRRTPATRPTRALPHPTTRATAASASAPRVLVLHGPNLNLLGTRELDIYGGTTLAEIDRALLALAAKIGLALDVHQSNHEGVLIDLIHAARERAQGIIINPGGYTHTSVALRDALVAVSLPAVEVHLSNTAARESFRHASLTGAACVGRIEGFGPMSYQLALQAVAHEIATRAAQDAADDDAG